MTLPDKDILDLWEIQRDKIPRPVTIFNETVEKLGLADKSPTWHRTNFEETLVGLMDLGWEILKPYQNRAQNAFLVEIWRQSSPGYEQRAKEIIQDAMSEGLKPHEKVLKVVEEFLQDIPPIAPVTAQKSITNMNKKRAGVHMEASMAYLFQRCGFSFEQQRPKKTDFVFPNLKTYKERPEKSLLVSAKNTLAERWKELAAEVKGTGRNVYLVTLDQNNTQSRFEDLRDCGIFTYVRESEYQKFKDVGNVRSLKTLIDDVRAVVPFMVQNAPPIVAPVTVIPVNPQTKIV